jgi:hypothetical protein
MLIFSVRQFRLNICVITMLTTNQLNGINMKLFYFVALALLFTSCQKENTAPATADVSGKIKSITVSYVPLLIKQTQRYDFIYDASNRVLSISTLLADSSVNPAQVISNQKITFFYTGTDDKPFKGVFYDSAQGNYLQLTRFFYYDNQNRLIKKEAFENGRLFIRTLSNYTANFNSVKDYYFDYRSGTGIQTLASFDTAFLDNQTRCAKLNTYDTLYATTTKEQYTYDAKNNPLALLNVNKCMADLSTSKTTYNYSQFNFFTTNLRLVNAINNITGYTNQTTDPIYGTNKTIITFERTYSTNDFPVSAQWKITDNPAVPATDFAIVNYEYY